MSVWTGKDESRCLLQPWCLFYTWGPDCGWTAPAPSWAPEANQKCSSKRPATDPVALSPWVLGSPGDSFQVKFVWQGAHLTQQDTKPSTPTPGPLPILQSPLILCPGGAGFSACRGSYGRMVCLFLSILLFLLEEGACVVSFGSSLSPWNHALCLVGA